MLRTRKIAFRAAVEEIQQSHQQNHGPNVVVISVLEQRCQRQLEKQIASVQKRMRVLTSAARPVDNKCDSYKNDIGLECDTAASAVPELGEIQIQVLPALIDGVYKIKVLGLTTVFVRGEIKREGE